MMLVLFVTMFGEYIDWRDVPGSIDRIVNARSVGTEAYAVKLRRFFKFICCSSDDDDDVLTPPPPPLPVIDSFTFATVSEATSDTAFPT
jgi:hypothetical protein